MFSGRPGDIRGMGLMLGVAGLVVVVIWYVTLLLWSIERGVLIISRIAHVLLPRPWRLYSDRVEFTSIAMLWICWTCMSFNSWK
jgi:hypothetical protein